MSGFFDFVGTGPLLIVVAIVVLVLIASYVASRYRVANANEALIVAGSHGARVRDERGQVAASTGRDDKGIRVVVGGGTFVLPLIHRVGKMKLTARQIAVSLGDAVTSQGIKVAVQGVATFKIGRDVESIRNAAERFLDSRDDQVDSIVKNVLEGSLRSIVGTLTIEELISDRQKLLQQVQDSAKGDLATSGLQIDAFTIQSISDESGYIDLLGQQKLALVERDARMAKAGADQEAAVREAAAQQIKIDAERDVALRRAETETQTTAAQARASQAGPLAQAEAQQEVTRRQTELADLEAGRREKELLAATIRPAEADATAAVRRAEGERQAKIAAAQAEAERQKLAGEAEAAVLRMRGEAQARVVSVNAEAEAHRTAVEGNAEAGVTLTKGEAEAKALALRAEAYKQFNDAAVIQTVLSSLPAIVSAAAEPMEKIGSLTILSSDGASEVVRTTTRTVAEAGAAIQGLTGLDIPNLIGDAVRRGGGGRGDGGNGRAEGANGNGRSGEAPRATTRTRRASAQTEGGAVTGGPATPEPAAAFADAVDTIQRAGTTGLPAEPTAAPGAAEASARPRPEDAPARLEAAASAPPDEFAALLGTELRRVPGIERYRDATVAELEHRGPRLARGMWRAAASRLGERYGSMTIGELLRRGDTQRDR